MRPVVLSILAVAIGCGSEAADPFAVRTFEFGPFEVAPGEEVADRCVQITLHNDDYLYINSVELTTGPGFHHSNWFFVPERTFAGDDGAYTCKDRDFNEPVAAIFGGVLFAQSTQAQHEIQQFPEGVVIKIPPHSKVVTQIHLLNATEGPLSIHPTIALQPVPERDVVTTLAGISFQNEAIALPPDKASRFGVECDLDPTHEMLFSRAPDFKIYYGLAHYHELGTGLTVEAVRPDGTAATVFSTETKIGDTLGGPITPAFDMTGYTKLRFWCEYYNPRQDTVRWGIGDQEMCVFLAFSDSTYNWGGGVTERSEPLNPVEVGNSMQYTNPCTVFANDASR
jgi:hypothetical protein